MQVKDAFNHHISCIKLRIKFKKIKSYSNKLLANRKINQLICSKFMKKVTRLNALALNGEENLEACVKFTKACATK